jgi:hypothetical protein
MAAKLVDKDSLQRTRYDLHARGEDVRFSLDAAKKGIPLLWWLSSVKCEHLMERPKHAA